MNSLFIPESVVEVVTGNGIVGAEVETEIVNDTKTSTGQGQGHPEGGRRTKKMSKFDLN